MSNTFKAIDVVGLYSRYIFPNPDTYERVFKYFAELDFQAGLPEVPSPSGCPQALLTLVETTRPDIALYTKAYVASWGYKTLLPAMLALPDVVVIQDIETVIEEHERKMQIWFEKFIRENTQI